MQIEKVNKSKYKISGLVRTNVLRDILELFDISSSNDNDNEITINKVKSFQSFKDWEKTQHPLIDYTSAEELFDNFAAISLYLEKIGLQFSHIEVGSFYLYDSSNHRWAFHTKSHDK